MTRAVRFAGTRRRGFTLIEILIALVVLFIGIVGIIALFPIGIESTRSSVQDTNAALIAESIHHAIILAMRNANAQGEAWIVHDGCPLQPSATSPPNSGTYGGRCAYPLILTDPAGNPVPPALPPGPDQAHPINPVAYSTGAQTDIFQLTRDSDGASAGDPTYDPLRRTVEDIRGAAIAAPPDAIQGSDTTIDYSQYYWNFYVGQVTDAAGVRLPLFQFRIRIWRGYRNGSYNHATDPGDLPPEFIQEFRVLVASNS